ncbi:MAG: hypothetical protein LC122_13895 [Chitinophagales bacterium]|nr:hypothetical protein [Chitinophagales bacterium]
MNIDKLNDLLPQITPKILRNYSHGFSLGVTKDRRGNAYLRLRLEKPDASIPHKITIDREVIEIAISCDFKRPHA